MELMGKEVDGSQSQRAPVEHLVPHPPDDELSSPKKSVLSKVKDKAKKLKSSLTLKKKINNINGNAATPTPHDQEDAEYHGAPIYDSELAGEKKNVLSDKAPWDVPEKEEAEEEEIEESKNLPQTCPTTTKTATSSPHKFRDYLLNKFEPAEEDRALSRAISQAFTTTSTTTDVTVADEVRDAVTSLLRNHPPPLLTRSDTPPSMPRHIPISTNPHPHPVEEEGEDNVTRLLQTN